MNVSSERIGPYRILHTIGKGGFGEVFEAVHEHMGQHVALKVLLPEHAKDPDTAARFTREARALAQFPTHPGIVQVHHFDRPESGIAYLAMELLRGKTLRAWLCEHTEPVQFESALTIGKQIAAIMVDVHAKEFVHRDLKPENIMLVPDDQPLGFRPKILDFGIAKAPEPTIVDGRADTHIKTSGCNVLGTHVYMAPEQIRNADNIDEKADVYVLGIVMYELLVGKPPFQSESEIELVWMHGRDIPKNLHEILPSIPPMLASFVASMLAKAPADRPSMRDCREMFARDWLHENIDCPFPGLQPFTDSQAHLFFGRREETTAIHALLDEIREGKSRRWVQIQGPSGTGKSSIVHAAIVPALLRSKQWRVVTLRPTEDPIRSIATALANAYEKDESEVVAAFRERPEALDAFVCKHHTSETTLLIIIDQFEELFALGGAHVAALEALLAKAFENAHSSLHVLTTIRSDYLHRFDQALGLARLLDDYALRYDLRPMDETALAEVIDGMAGRAGLCLSEGLPKKMVQDASGTDCQLPLLGHTLRTLWSLRSGGEIKHEHYARIGGVGGALAKHVAQLLEDLGNDGRERAKWLVLDLVQVGRGAPDTRRPRTRAEVIDAAGSDELAEDVLLRLSGIPANGSETEHFRLVVLSDDALDPARQRVDMVHEMVLQKVPIVVGWINAERELLERLAALESVAYGWLAAGQPKKDLPTGSLLDHYRGGKNEGQRQRILRMASAHAREFLKAATLFERRQRRIWIGVGAVMLIAVVSIAIGAVIARQERRRAEQEAAHARANLEAMLDMADKMVNNVDWPLSRLGRTLPLRRKILEPLHEQLLRLEASDKNGLRLRVIETKHRLSDLERLNGTLEASYELLVEARNRIDEGLEQDGASATLRELLALYYSKHGKLLLAENKFNGARGDFVKSIELLNKLKDNEGFELQILATSYLERADAELRAEPPGDSAEWYDKAIALRKEIAKSDGEAYSQAMVADALIHRACAALAHGQTASARADVTEALQLQQPLATKEAHNMLYQLILAQVYVSLGAVFREEKQSSEAANLYEKARELGERMYANDPEHKENALVLINALEGLHAVGDGMQMGLWSKRRCEVTEKFARKDNGRDRRFVREGCSSASK